MADDENMAAAKKRLAEDQEITNKIKEDYLSKMKGKPTPTQEENDLAACGAHFHEHEADGSDPDPNVHTSKQMEAGKNHGTAYQTRQARHTTHTPSSSS
jgi:hypothetical protein